MATGGVNFVDENDFQNVGKWYIRRKSEQEIDCNRLQPSVSNVSNEMSDFSDEFDFESESEFSTSSTYSATSDSDSDIDYSEDKNTVSRKKNNSSQSSKRKLRENVLQKGKKVQATSEKKQSNLKKDGNRAVQRNSNKKRNKNTKALTDKELEDLRAKLLEKQPMCWSFVSEQLKIQQVIKYYESHRQLIHEILDVRYGELRDLVNNMFSSYIEFVSDVTKETRTDRKAKLTMRWMKHLLRYLDGDSNNNYSKVCSCVFAKLSHEYSSSTIRDITGILHSLVYDFAQSESSSISKPVDVETSVIPEDDVSLYRISGAALCQMIKLRKDTLSAKKGKRKLTPESRSQMETELDILVQLKETDKSHLPDALKLLDEGNLTFVKKELLPFVREADLGIREYVNERRLNKHKSKFLEVIHFNVYNDDELLRSFKWSLEKCVATSKDHEKCIDKIYSDMLHKLCNTRTK